MVKLFSWIMVIVCASSVYAHEARSVGDGEYILYVGLENEPAYEQQSNAFDLYIYRNNTTRNLVSLKSGDRVHLQVKALLFKEDILEADVQYELPLEHRLKKDQQTPSRYFVNFLPRTTGAYGLKVEGTINDVAVNETFICGKGTQDSEGYFSCVQGVEAINTTPVSGQQYHDHHQILKPDQLAGQ